MQVVPLATGFTMTTETMRFTELTLAEDKADASANNEVTLTVGGRFSPRAAVSEQRQPAQYLIVTMRPGDGLGEHEWEIRRFGRCGQRRLSSPRTKTCPALC